MAAQISTTFEMETLGIKFGHARLDKQEFSMLKQSARCTRRPHTPTLKVRVALAALREDKTTAQLCKQFELHPNRISDWKTQLLQNAVNVCLRHRRGLDAR